MFEKKKACLADWTIAVWSKSFFIEKKYLSVSYCLKNEKSLLDS